MDTREALLQFIDGYDSGKFKEGHHWPVSVYDDQKNLVASYEVSTNEYGDLLTQTHETPIHADEAFNRRRGTVVLGL